jgi:uncharacterized membrane protein YdjX (TVP38/TMEM64 family)
VGFFERVTSLIESWRGEPMLPAILFGLYFVFGVLHLSPWFLVLQTGLLLKPPLSIVVAFAGLNGSAYVFFGVGRVLRRWVQRFIGPRTRKVIDGAGFEGVLFLRLLPLLPYSLVNWSAGALGMRFATFALATAIGITPLLLLVTLLGHQAMEVIEHPTPASVGLLILVVVAFVAVSFGLRAWRKRRESRGTPA